MLFQRAKLKGKRVSENRGSRELVGYEAEVDGRHIWIGLDRAGVHGSFVTKSKRNT